MLCLRKEGQSVKVMEEVRWRMTGNLKLPDAIIDFFCSWFLSLENREVWSALENKLEKDISWCELEAAWGTKPGTDRVRNSHCPPLLQALRIPGMKGEVWAGLQSVIEEGLKATSRECCWRSFGQNYQTNLWLHLCWYVAWGVFVGRSRWNETVCKWKQIKK